MAIPPRGQNPKNMSVNVTGVTKMSQNEACYIGYNRGALLYSTAWRSGRDISDKRGSSIYLQC